QVQAKSVAPMFPLNQLPQGFGSWLAKEGGEEALDPQIARIAGSHDSLVRVYVNSQTGVAINLLVIYGSGERVSAHTPERCYPSVGYVQHDDPAVKTVKYGRSTAAFRSLLYVRKGDAVAREEVYYAFRQRGQWSPDVEGNWKALSADPSMFKVQI